MQNIGPELCAALGPGLAHGEREFGFAALGAGLAVLGAGVGMIAGGAKLLQVVSVAPTSITAGLRF